jgi:flavin reductase (DIM6/NTAB) family NADH-FMN oxidoreductase RutF
MSQAVDTSEFRRVMGHFPTGVVVVTSRQPDGQLCGLTVNAFCSVSLQPALVLVCIDGEADSHDCIRETGVFAVSVLDERKGELLSRRFAGDRVEDKFAGVAYREEVTGAPVLDASIAWLDCHVVQAIPAGDHTVFLGEVVAADAQEGQPLVYYRGGYGRFIP